MNGSIGSALASWLPAPSISRYVLKLFLTRFGAVLALVIAVLQLLDMLNRSDEILTATGATAESLFRYALLRAPELMTEFAPFVALLAALLTLAELSQTSEITVMRAAGLSAYRILFPIGVGCFLIAVAHFLFHETMTVRTRAQLAYWEANGFAVDVSPPPQVRTNVWLARGEDFIKAESVSRSGARVLLEGVTIYKRNAAGAMEGVTRADFAWHNNGQWTMSKVRESDVGADETTSAPWSEWDLELPPKRFFEGGVKADQTGLGGLARAISQRRREGADTQDLETAWLQRFAAPASSLLMPLLAAVAGFGVNRSGSLLARTALGLGLGFSFFVADKFMVVMGELGIAPPFFAAFSPILFYVLVGFSTLFFVEEF
ncbi:MAG: LPS export ABC transporter permease LptG [Pseudomonadota bacterium]